MIFPNLETAHPCAVRPKIGSAVDGHPSENFRRACTVTVRLVNKVAGPVQCLPCPDQLGNFVSEYFLGGVLCLYLPTLSGSEIFCRFVSAHPLHPLLPQLVEKLGPVTEFCGGRAGATATVSPVSAPSGGTTRRPGWFASRCKALQSVEISAR